MRFKILIPYLCSEGSIILAASIQATAQHRLEGTLNTCPAITDSRPSRTFSLLTLDSPIRSIPIALMQVDKD